MNVTHDSTEAFEGILWSYRGGWITLRDVSALKADRPPTPIPGDVILDRARVAYFQVVS